MKSLISMVTVFASLQLVAGVCTWTGKAGDGKWSSSGNWSAVPTASDEVDFAPGSGAELTVTLDSPGLTTIQFLKVASGTVTLKAVEGASLRTAGSGVLNGLIVSAGAELDLEAPLDLTSRFDKSGEGTVRFRSSLENTYASYSYFAAGRCIFESGSDIHFAGEVGFGLNGDVKLEFADGAVARFSNTVTYGLNDTKDSCVDVLIDGATVTAWNLVLNKNVGAAKRSLVVRRGKLSVSRGFKVDDAEAFELAGGTLSLGADVTLDKKLSISGSSAIEVASGKTLAMTKSPELGEDTVFVKKGAGKLLVQADVTARGTLSVEAGELCFDAGVTVRNPAGVYTPYPISIGDGAVLRMEAVTTRFSLPLDLSIAATGKVAMSEGENGYTCKSVLVAHKLTVGGTVKGKGRFTPCDNLTGGPGCSIVIPYVWTGASGDNCWNTPGNWDNNAVPAIHGATAVDISVAEEPVRLDTEAKFGCLISMPGAGKTRTVTGDGIVNLRISSSYACAAYVEEESELVLDVGLEKETGAYLTMLGGGTVVAKKSYPTLNGNVPPFVLDATVKLDGAMKPTTDFYLGAMSHRKEGRGVMSIGDDADLNFKILFVTAASAGEFPPKEIRQIGGAVQLANAYITHYDTADNAPDPFAYVLDGGTLGVSDSIYLGQHYTSKFSNIYPGGSFIMNGGTARMWTLKSWRNQNYFRLNGGDLYSRTFAQTDPPAANVGSGRVELNDTAYELGAVTLHPINAAGLTVSANATLTGVGGDAIAACGESANFVKFASGYALDGVGGIRKTGAGKLSFCGTTKFAGALTVDEGTAAFESTATLDGVSRFVVTDAAARITVDGTVTKSPDVIELKSSSCLSLATGRTLTVKRLVVGDADYAAGSYGFGDGTVTVVGRGDGIWTGADGAAWSVGDNWASGAAPASGASVDFSASALSEDASIVLDVPIAVSSIAYARAGAAGTLTLSGSAALTLSAEGTVFVDEGDTLVLTAPLRLGGNVRKLGGGRLVLRGGVTAESACTFTADAGELEISGPLGNVTFTATSGILALGEGIVTSEGVFARPPDVLTLSGTTSFAQPSAAATAELISDLSGAGTVCQVGPGVLALSGNVAGADLLLSGGTLSVGAAAAASMDGTRTLSVSNPKQSALVLDFVGEAKVLKLVVSGRERKPGLYDANLQRVTGSAAVSTKGYLRVLTGNPPGSCIVVR